MEARIRARLSGKGPSSPSKAAPKAAPVASSKTGAASATAAASTTATAACPGGSRKSSSKGAVSLPGVPEGAASVCKDTPATSFEVGGGASAEQPVGSTEGSPATRNLNKRMSNASLQTVGELDSISAQLEMMRLQSENATAALASATCGAEVPVGLRNELSQLHGNANKLLATRLDAILTGDLNTGRDEARARRKLMIRDVEALIEKTEEQVKHIDRLR